MSDGEISNQNKRELEASQNQPSNSRQGQMEQVLIRGEVYQGSLPDPEMLMRYKNADPSFPDRIVKMAENHNAADVHMKNGYVFSATAIPILGQVFTFLLGVGSLCVCVYLAGKGYTGEAIAAVIAGFSPIIINALKSFKQNGHSKKNDS
jgi:uncharacterized membrane protein